MQWLLTLATLNSLNSYLGFSTSTLIADRIRVLAEKQAGLKDTKHEGEITVKNERIEKLEAIVFKERMRAQGRIRHDTVVNPGAAAGVGAENPSASNPVSLGPAAAPPT